MYDDVPDPYGSSKQPFFNVDEYTASIALDLSERCAKEFVDKDLKKIVTKIMQTAKQGRRKLVYDGDFTIWTKDELVNLGYTVRLGQNRDFRGEPSSSYLEISW